MKFVKMEGLANDFILTHHVSEQKVDAIGKIATMLCDRRRGIGGDGVILVLPSKAADYQMRIFNADGSEPEMCGNGIRCFALYVQKTGLWKKPELSVETISGIIKTEISGDRIKVTMSAPIVDARASLSPNRAAGRLWNPYMLMGKFFNYPRCPWAILTRSSMSMN